MLKPAMAATIPSTPRNEDGRGQVEHADKRDEGTERADPIATDGEGHRAEGSDRSEAHQQVDSCKEQFAAGIDHLPDRTPLLTKACQRVPDYDRDEHDGEDVALGEGIDDGVRNDVQKEINDALLVRFASILPDRL